MYITILGRQSALGLAELERSYGQAHRYAPHAARIQRAPNILRLGGSLKAGQITLEVSSAQWPIIHKRIVQHYEKKWQTSQQKITLGISAYNLRVTPKDIQRTALTLKKSLKSHEVSMRILPNTDIALNTATSHHNKLGLSPHKIELLVVGGSDGTVVVAESTGAQNITALAARDQGRPKRDAFVGMLPPKLALLMTNLALGPTTDRPLRVLDPFCGTGVLLQEAMLLGHHAYGTDLSEKMIDFSRTNLLWAQDKLRATTQFELAQADAMSASWTLPIDAVACETYLGQPFSAPPSPSKLREVRGNCNHIISTFLRNLSTQLAPGTPLCIGVPAWRSQDGSFTHLPFIKEIEILGFRRVPLTSVRHSELLYYRDDQVVARELLILEKI